MTTEDNVTEMSLTMPDTVATEPDVTPAVRRAADVLFAAELTGLIYDDVRAGLVAALTDEALTAVFHRHHMKGGAGNPTCVCSWEPDWTKGPWIPQFDVHLATALRAAIVGEARG